MKLAINKAVNTTLNSLDEYLLAKKILKYDKFANKVKFARAGGEAMSIAIRIARAKINIQKLHLVDIMGGKIGILLQI